jgi:SpoIID/LytB domain protein
MKRTLVLAIASVLSLATLAGFGGGSASADTTFTFYGAGWGHGIGMSQYGAYGLATQGLSATSILAHYYAGTGLKTISSPSTLRVGLLQYQSGIQLKGTNGPVALKLGSASSPLIGTIPEGQTWTIRARGTDGKFLITKSDGSFLGGHAWGGPATPLIALYVYAHTIVYVPDTGHRYNAGQFEFNSYKPCDSCSYHTRLIAIVGTNTYVYGIAEVPSSWPSAALRAQAIASRTYAVHQADTLGQHRSGCNCAVYSSTADQVYSGYDKIAGADGARWKAAADQTASLVVTYAGAPIAAFYSSSSGGHTASNADEWGGTQLPYLQGRCDPGDYTPANPNRTWTVQMSGSAVGTKVSSYTGTTIGAATSITVNGRSGSGRIDTVTVHGSQSSATLTGTAFRAALGLRSSLVWVNSNKLITGAIRAYYDHIHCAPGVPTSGKEQSGNGLKQMFTGGNIYLDVVHGNHPAYLHQGGILTKFISLHGTSGVLGFPTTDIVDRPYGARAAFVSGVIYNSDPTGPHETHGIVMTAYFNHGGADGSLGLPTTDVQVSGSMRRQDFQHGSISCNTGTHTCSTSTA